MILITATILLTCCSFAAADSVQCGKDTSCVKLWECPHYTQPLKEYDNQSKNISIHNVTNNVCVLDGNIPKVCCEEPLNYGKIKKFTNGGTPLMYCITWTALLIYNTTSGHKIGCTGALISDRHVLTTGECVGLAYYDQLVSVRLGIDQLLLAEDCIKNPNLSYCTSGVIEVGIERIIRHEGYDNSNDTSAGSFFGYNIAVLKLDRSVISNDIQPIRLPEPVPDLSQQEQTNNNTTSIAPLFYMFGWGVSLEHDPKFSHKTATQFWQIKTDCVDTPEDRMYFNSVLEDYDVDQGGALIAYTETETSLVGLYSFTNSSFPKYCRYRPDFIDVRQYLDWIQLQLI